MPAETVVELATNVDQSTAYALWAGAGTFVAVFIATLLQYRKSFASTVPPPVKAESPIGDMRVFAAAFNDRNLLMEIGKHLEKISEHADSNSKHLETIADEMKRIRRQMQDTEDRMITSGRRGERQDTL